MTEREAIESTYFDKFSSFRRRNVKDEVTKQTKQEFTPVLENQLCALSQDKQSATSFGNHTGETENEYTLFHAPELDVKAGDKLVVTTGVGQIITCYPGDPFCYPSHAETMCSKKEKT